MSNTKIKAAQFHGVVGHGTDGYFLMTNADGSMSWSQASTGPSVTSVAYPGDDLAADPAGAQTVVLTGTGFAASGMTVSIGGTTAPSVAHDSNTQLTITTPAKAAGDYDIVVTNTVTGASGTFVNGISYNGVPTWTTAAGSLGTFESETTISTITLAATEPDGGTITFNITNGALPSGLSLTGANIDGTTTAESSTTLYSFTIEAIDDENQATPRNFSITVNSAEIVPSQNFTINTYEGTGSTQSIEGKIGTAAEFNGSSSKIVTTLNPNGFSQITLSCWINTTSSGTNDHIISSNDGTNWCFLSMASGIITFGASNGGSGIFSATHTGAINDGNWHHICASYNGTTATLYIDGTGYTPVSATASLSVNVAFGIGYRNTASPSGTYYDGKIDQVRIFNRGLDETNDGEVTTLYNEPSNLSTASTTDIFDDGSGVALYEFEKGAIDTGGVSGYIGAGAAVFNGSSSNINIGTELIPATSNFSLSFWIYRSNSTEVDLFNQSNASASIRTYFKLYTNGTLGVYSAGTDGSRIQVPATTSTVTNGQWEHIAIVRDGSSMMFYINGTGETETISGGTVGVGRGDLAIISNNALGGKLDQVRIFNKALSSSEVTTLYGETSASSTKSTTDIFDDGSGVALYELEGNANDTGLYGSGAIDAGQSAVFNGSSSYIDTNISTITSNSGSVSLWVKTTTGTQSSFFGGQSPSQNRFYFGVRNNNFWMGAGDSQNSYNISASSLLDGNWHHVVLTLDGSTAKYYLDGNSTPVDTLSYTSAGTIGVTPLIGALDATGSILAYTNGSIDQVRIYSSALSSSDVKALASETNVPTANLVAHYKLDGDATDEIASNNGTWSGTQAYSDPAEFPAYDGTATNVTYGYNGTPTNVSFVGTSFQPDLVWTKSYAGLGWWHFIQDSVRGTTSALFSNNTEPAGTFTDAIQSFDSNGYTIGSTGSLNYDSSNSYVAWCWKAGGTAVSNTDGAITSEVSANQDAGFSIVKYVGSSTSGLDIGHGLSSAPEMVILKNLDSSHNWYIYHKDTGTTSGYINYLRFDATTGTYSDKVFYPVDFNNSTFIAGHDPVLQGNMIAYCFHSVDGYQKLGSYQGTGVTGNKQTIGFRPRFLLSKRTSSASSWYMIDSTRNTTNPRNSFLNANTSDAEYSPTYGVNFEDDGFSFISTDLNGTNQTWIYLAIA